jgi:hypothetical protein
MTTELPPVRRIVTANNMQGRSYIAEDGVSPAMLTMPGRSGFRNNNLWRTIGSPADVHVSDSVLEHRGVMPPPGGTVLRVIDIPPESADADERARATTATFKQLYPDAIHQPDQRHPGMHVTPTIDYAIVLHGEIYAVMDEDETVMKAGDILIQRGTNHAWSNRSGAIARIAFILVDGRR